jgi:hypothetical protein
MSAIANGELNDLQFSCITLEILYAIECLVRVGILHLDLHLNNIILIKDPSNGHKVYEYIDRDGGLTTFYIPSYGWNVKIFDFDRGLKHQPRMFLQMKVLSDFDGEVRNDFLTHHDPESR